MAFELLQFVASSKSCCEIYKGIWVERERYKAIFNLIQKFRIEYYHTIYTNDKTLSQVSQYGKKLGWTIYIHFPYTQR